MPLDKLKELQYARAREMPTQEELSKLSKEELQYARKCENELKIMVGWGTPKPIRLWRLRKTILRWQWS